MERYNIEKNALSVTNRYMFSSLKPALKKHKLKYLMALPVVLYFLLFCYKPMYGVIIAFKDYSPSVGITNSPWVGLKHFIDFFYSIYFERVMTNTFLISFYDILLGFPAPIILALLLNEIRNNAFKRTVQTISYLPYFISMVIICGLIKEFAASDSFINIIIQYMGGERTSFLQKPEFFKGIYVATNIWQQMGWGSIIYLAALTAIDNTLYEASMIDGAGRFRQICHITIPGIMPTIVVLLILRIGNILNVGFEKILLLYNPVTYETADVISTYVYREGLLNFNWSYSTAVGLFNSVINFTFLIISNWISRRINETSLW